MELLVLACGVIDFRWWYYWFWSTVLLIFTNELVKTNQKIKFAKQIKSLCFYKLSL